MDNGRIYKVLIIEPSAIVGAGIRTLLDGFSEFRALDAETTGDPATCFERVATTGPDLVLINPALFPVMRRTPIAAARVRRSNQSLRLTGTGASQTSAGSRADAYDGTA